MSVREELHESFEAWNTSMSISERRRTTLYDAIYWVANWTANKCADIAKNCPMGEAEERLRQLAKELDTK